MEVKKTFDEQEQQSLIQSLTTRITALENK